jgi:hypothetical protein
VALSMCALYAFTALQADSALGWANSWMAPAILSIVVLVTAFVLTKNRAGTRGSVLSDLGSALRRPNLQDPVEGVAHVVTASGLPRSGQNAGSAMCEMNLVVSVPGQPSVAVSTASVVALAKWPAAGMSLPVLAERTDPREFRILWDRVDTGWDRGVAAAQAFADQLNAEAPESDRTASFRVLGTVSVNGRAASAEEIAAVETLTGMDLDGDGALGRTSSPDPDPTT